MTNSKLDLIDALFECVKRSDWNCCAEDKPELYDIWNKIMSNDSLKAELEQELENSIPFLHGDCDNEKRLEQENKQLKEKAEKWDEFVQFNNLSPAIESLRFSEILPKLEQENKRLEDLEDECVKGAVRMIKLENENKELKNGMSDFKKIVDENNILKEKYNNQYETTLELREDRLRDKEKLEKIKAEINREPKAYISSNFLKQILDEESK